MAKGIIDPKLAEALRASPNVERVMPRTVVFKPSFIEHALYQYLHAGKARVEIFRKAGIDVDALGKERLKTAFGNWLTKHKRGIPMLPAVAEEPRKEKRQVVLPSQFIRPCLFCFFLADYLTWGPLCVLPIFIFYNILCDYLAKTL